jgi:hypothetical protein
MIVEDVLFCPVKSIIILVFEKNLTKIATLENRMNYLLN